MRADEKRGATCVSPLPHLTNSLIRRFEELEALTTEDRLRGMQAQPGNPWGIEIRRFGRATAFLARKIPVHQFNRVLGVGIEDLGLLDDLAAFGRQSPVAFGIEILPGDLDEHLSKELSVLEYRQCEFHAGFYGPASADVGLRSAVAVKRVDKATEFEEFLETHFEAYELPAALKDIIVPNMRPWRTFSDWHLYLAEIDGAPAAAAVLRIHGRLGYLASAATVPRFRRRGCQSALLARRIEDAAEIGCDLVCSQAAFGSTSHHNLERAGLRLAYTKAIWRRSSATAG